MIRIRRGPAGRGARIELSPLAMVLFALVAFFVMWFLISMNRRSIPVDVTGWGENADVVITVTGNDSFFWTHEGPIPISDFSGELMRRRPSRGYEGISVGGDRLASHGNVMRIFDEARAAGESRFGMDTRLREVLVALP